MDQVGNTQIDVRSHARAQRRVDLPQVAGLSRIGLRVGLEARGHQPQPLVNP